MSNIEAQLRKHIPKSGKDLKPNASSPLLRLRTHAFHGVIMVLGWIAPPVAVLVRFGVGFDLVLNTILTICGYIPGHAHNFYIQNIRNNKSHKRTPKWAIRAGLVKMKDPRAGRHQWANRYDERVAGGADDGDSIRSQSWDGRGPEPQRRGKPLGGSRKPHRHVLSPWDDYVDEDEVEGGANDGLYRTQSRRYGDNNDDLTAGRNSTSSRRTEPEFDPLTNEQFYAPPAAAPLRATPTGGGKKKFPGSGLLKNRSRYEQPFDTNDAVSSRTRGSDGGYQDEFEREINEGSGGARNGSAAGAGRFDTFEAEGPEDAWASSARASTTTRGAGAGNGYGNGNGYSAAQAPLQPQRTGRAEETDGDLFKHTF
ncbi:hypothetical protein JCM10908_004354 [Rhodotorula pacifica]|uniref:YqaE/Pmp3 family membrane protein n=1 Tax=Rhodotorula pacifica TaxID=1495444 RepID=UPI003171DD86